MTIVDPYIRINLRQNLPPLYQLPTLSPNIRSPGVALLKMALELPEDGRAWALDTKEDYCNVGKPFMKEAGVLDKVR